MKVIIFLIFLLISYCFAFNYNFYISNKEYNKFQFESPYCKTFDLYLDKCDSNICGGGCGKVTLNSTDSNTFNFHIYNDAQCNSVQGTTFTCENNGPVIVSPFKIFCKNTIPNTIINNQLTNKIK